MGTRKVANFKKGDRVAILNQTYSGKAIVEGLAQVVRPEADGRYYVRFFRAGGLEKEQFLRFVDPKAQDDPHKYVDEMNAPRELLDAMIDDYHAKGR